MRKLTILLAVGITAIAVVEIIRRIQSARVRTKIANEGYETAHDILYPLQKFSKKSSLPSELN